MKKKTLRILSIIWYLLAVCLLFVTLAHHDAVCNTVKLTTSGFLDDPAPFHGLVKHTAAPFSHFFDEGFFINHNKKLIPVHYKEEYYPPHFGEVLVYGSFHKDGYIDAVAVHNYDYNYVLYVLSFLAGVFVISCFFVEWKITLRGFKSA